MKHCERRQLSRTKWRTSKHERTNTHNETEILNQLNLLIKIFTFFCFFLSFSFPSVHLFLLAVCFLCFFIFFLFLCVFHLFDVIVKNISKSGPRFFWNCDSRTEVGLNLKQTSKFTVLSDLAIRSHFGYFKNHLVISILIWRFLNLTTFWATFQK